MRTQGSLSSACLAQQQHLCLETLPPSPLQRVLQVFARSSKFSLFDPAKEMVSPTGWFGSLVHTKAVG